MNRVWVEDYFVSTATTSTTLLSTLPGIMTHLNPAGLTLRIYSEMQNEG